MCHTYLQVECWQHVGGVLRILVPRAVASPPWRGYPGARARERKKRRSVACGNTSGYRPTRDSEAGRTPSAGAPPELLRPRDHIPQPKALSSAREGPAAVPARMLSAPLIRTAYPHRYPQRYPPKTQVAVAATRRECEDAR